MQWSGRWNVSTELVFLWKSSDSAELKKKKCAFYFSNEQRYCSCKCPDFKNNRRIFKHFFVVTEGNHWTFNDISQLSMIIAK